MKRVVVIVIAATLSTVTPAVGTAGSAAALVGPVASAVDVVSGPQAASTCARFADGTLKCWGYNLYGQLGYGDTTHRGDGPGEMGDALPPVDLGTGRTVVDAAVGDLNTCAVLDNGQVKCWGWNVYGQLGLGDTANRGDGPGEMGDALPAIALGAGRTARAVAVGQGFACAILDNGTVKCWGRNDLGQLGLGDTATRGDGPGEMGDALPAVDLGPGRTAVSIAASPFHTCAVLDNGAVKCWGWNANGQLGLGDTATRGDGAGEMGAALPAVALGTGRTARSLALGTFSTCVLLDDATVKCWGSNDFGQLGNGSGTSATVGDGPGEMGDSLAAVQLGTGRTTVELVAGFAHVCARLDNAAVKCWGRGSRGQLGSGSPSDVGRFAIQMGDNLPAADLGTGRTAVGLAAGNDFGCARLDDGTLKCWGGNDFGQLGLGDTVTRGRFPGEMGDALPPVDLGHLALAPALTVTTTADETTVPVGTPIHFHVTLTNTGNVPLTGVTVTDAQVPGCAGAQADLAVGASRTVDCTYTPTVDDIGTVSNAATGDAAEVEPVTSSTVDVAVTIPSGQAVLKGTVTVGFFGNPVPGALVAALAPADFSVAGLDLTAADGTFAMLVPAGSYFVYVADPSGGHIAGFVPGSPTALGDGATVVVDPEVTRSTGSIGGRITDATSGDGIARGLALSLNAATGQIGRGAATMDDRSGWFAIPSLPLVSQYVVMVDLAGAHRPTFFGGTPSPAGATPVTVPAGAQQNIGDTPLESQPAPGGAARVQGTVTGPGGAPLEGVAVLARSASTFRFAGGDLTDAAGRYEVPVDAGDYLVGFADTAGTHTFEWHANRSSSELGSADTVTAGVGSPAVVDAELAGATGTIAGTITEDGSGAPVSDAWVFAIDSSGSVVGVGRTAPDGTYSIAGLPALPVRVRIMDLTRAHVPEYYDNHPGPGAGSDYPSATVVTVTGGATTTVDAGLALLTP